jgi:hypothetical protein
LGRRSIDRTSLGSVLEAASAPRLRRPAFFGVSWRNHVLNLASVGGAAATIAGFFLLFGLSGQEIVASFTIILIGIILVGIFFPFIAHPEDRDFLRRVVIAGVLVRIGLCLTAHATLPVGFFAPDQFTFQDAGWRTLLFIRGLGAAPRQISGQVEVGYFYWNAFLFAIFGFAPIAAKLVNCFVGVATALVAYRIAGGLAGRRAALNAAVITMFFPSLVLWSTLNLRDAPVLFLISLIFYCTLRVRAKPSGPLLGLTFMLVVMLAFLRDYMAVMVVFSLLGAFTVSSKQQIGLSLFMGLMLFGAALLAYQQLGLGAQWIESAGFEALQTHRTNLAYGGSAFQPDADVSSSLRGLQYLPKGLAFFFLAPFPWRIGSTLTLITLPEMVVWYSLLPFVVSGAIHLLRTRFVATQPLILFVVLTGSVYALVEGNAGTAYRHRAQLILFMLIFASVGIETFRASQAKKTEGRRSPALPGARSTGQGHS